MTKKPDYDSSEKPTAKPGEKPSQMRRFSRVQPKKNAPLHVDINGDGFIDVLNAIDIGEGGMRIHVPHRFQGCHIEHPVTLVIRLPKPINRFIQVEGRIKHVLNESFGVQFIRLNEKSRALIRKYVASQLKEDNFWLYLRYILRLVD